MFDSNRQQGQGNNGGNQKKPPRDKMCFDDGKLTLWGKPLQEGASSPSFSIKPNENNPGVEINTGLKTDRGYPIKMEGRLDPIVFKTLLNLIVQVAGSPSGTAFEMECWGKPWIWDKGQGKNVRASEFMIECCLRVAKRDDGMVTLSAAAKNKPTIEFEFAPSEFHPITQNGQRVSVAISSPMAAAAWADSWTEIFFNRFVKDWKEPEFEKQKRLDRMKKAQEKFGGGGNRNGNNQRPQQSGGYNSGQNSGNGGQRPQSGGSNFEDFGDNDSFDEEIPF